MNEVSSEVKVEEIGDFKKWIDDNSPENIEKALLQKEFIDRCEGQIRENFNIIVSKLSSRGLFDLLWDLVGFRAKFEEDIRRNFGAIVTHLSENHLYTLLRFKPDFKTDFGEEFKEEIIKNFNVITKNLERFGNYYLDQLLQYVGFRTRFKNEINKYYDSKMGNSQESFVLQESNKAKQGLEDNMKVPAMEFGVNQPKLGD